jgi:hypothetical protein
MIRERTLDAVTAAMTIITAHFRPVPSHEPNSLVERRVADRGRIRPGHGRRASDRIRESAAKRAW